MELENGAADDVVRRLRRIEGQIGGVIKMLDDHRDCADVVTQLAAARRALDRTGFKLLSAVMRQCLNPSAEGERDPMSIEQLEKLFLSLA